MRIPTPTDFSSRLHDPLVATRVGLWLGLCFGICFLTGLVSHYAQEPVQPVPFPASPAWGYRVTQGLHVITGTAAVPLLLVKLWTVYPHFWSRLAGPGARRLALDAVHRLSIAVLVASSLFQLATGLANSSQWYPWSFSFRASHYAVGWVAVGALVLHVAVKLPVIRRELRDPVDDDPAEAEAAAGSAPGSPAVLSRRGLLRTTWLAAGAAALSTAGAAVPFLRDVSIFAVRSGSGPQGVPVNTSAEAADVVALATEDTWTLRLVNGEREVRLSREDLLAMPQRTEELPIACVEGWSASGTWTGVAVRDLLARVGAPAASAVVVHSLQPSGPFTETLLQPNFAADGRTLVALALNGEVLALDHGFPARLIAPNRPGVLQTKWLDRLEVRS